MTRISIRPVNLEDLPQLAELMNSEYARKKEANYFLWQYIHSYFPTVLYCAFFKTKPIGMLGLRKRKLNNGISIGQVIDVLVAREWRQKGILRKLYNLAMVHFPDLKAYFILANKNGKDVMEKGFLWKNVGRIDRMERFINIRKTYKKKIETQIRKNKGKIVYFPKNMKYYAWRFSQNPEYKYEKIPKKRSFAVVKIFTDPTTYKRYGDIVDIFCSLNDPTKLHDIYSRACRHLENQEIESITTWALPATTLHRMLKLMHFKKILQERFFLVHCLERKYNYLYNFSHWHLTEADTDLF